MKNQIFEFFLKEYLNGSIFAETDALVEDIVEDRLILIICSFFKVENNDSESEQAKIPKIISDRKIVKKLTKMNKSLISLVKENKIQIDSEIFDVIIFSNFII